MTWRKPTRKPTRKNAKKAGKKKSGSSAMAPGAAAVGSFTLRRCKAPRGEVLLQARTFLRKRKLAGRIHPRRVIPKVRAGTVRKDRAPSKALGLHAPRAMALALGQPSLLAATDTLEIVRNTSLGAAADHGTASNVCEPSLAASGDKVFYTGNWFASLSRDDGASFQWIDPYTTFPDPPGMEFCCDQIVHYIRAIDTFVWLLQYTENAAGRNIQRLAFAKSAEAAAGNWQYFDIGPADVGLGAEFLDYPDLAVGKNRLYLTFNSFKGSNWTTSVIVRIPFSAFKGGASGATYFKSTQFFNFRVAQECSTTAYFASHADTSTLRVWRWSEKAAKPTHKDVPVASWREAGYRSTTPDQRNWLGRADGRLTGATKAGGELWFCWGAGPGGANKRPQAYVQIARIKVAGLSLISNLNIWDAKSATCYGALSSNTRREVALVYAVGGGGRFPAFVVALLTGTRRDVVAVAGTRGPRDDKWGDYLTVRRDHPNGKAFVAAGYTLQASSSVAADATPQFVRFGRSGDV